MGTPAGGVLATNLTKAAARDSRVAVAAGREDCAPRIWPRDLCHKMGYGWTAATRMSEGEISFPCSSTKVS